MRLLVTKLIVIELLMCFSLRLNGIATDSTSKLLFGLGNRNDLYM